MWHLHLCVGLGDFAVLDCMEPKFVIRSSSQMGCADHIITEINNSSAKMFLHSQSFLEACLSVQLQYLSTTLSHVFVTVITQVTTHVSLFQFIQSALTCRVCLMCCFAASEEIMIIPSVQDKLLNSAV